MTRSCCVSVACSLAAVMIPATVAHADAVLDWNIHASQAIVTVAGQSPPRAFIRLAIVHLAIYDAVNAIEGQPFDSYASKPLVNRPASPDAAVAAAAHDVLVALFPAQAADLDAKYVTALNGLPDDAARANGVAVGQQAAAAILAARANDGRDGTVTYVPGSGPGVYAPTPPAFLAALSPETPLVQPFALQSASQFRPEPPPDLGSRLWARDYNETKALGGMVGSIRTAEQTDIGRFWSDNPPLQWIRAWRALSVGSFLRLADNARYFAMLSTASADALDCLLGRQVLLQLLAARHRDSLRRDRRQFANGAGRLMDRPGGHTESSRVPGRTRMPQRRRHTDLGALLRVR